MRERFVSRKIGDRYRVDISSFLGLPHLFARTDIFYPEDIGRGKAWDRRGLN